MNRPKKAEEEEVESQMRAFFEDHNGAGTWSLADVFQDAKKEEEVQEEVATKEEKSAEAKEEKTRKSKKKLEDERKQKARDRKRVWRAWQPEDKRLERLENRRILD